MVPTSEFPGPWNVGETGDCWPPNDMGSASDPIAGCCDEKTGNWEVGWEKKVPTVDTSEPELEGCRWPFGRSAGALGS